MGTYKWRVEFAHVDGTVPEEHPMHHGSGSMEIQTDELIETEQQKYEVAQAIGLKLDKTDIAIKAIIPLVTGEVVIDAGTGDE